MKARFTDNSIKERDAALLSLDKEMLLSYFKKYDIPCDYDSDLALWAGVHKARLQIVNMPEDAKEISRQWLTDNGFKESIDWDNL